MRIHRRQFLKYCMGSAAALGLPLTVIGKLENAFADDTVELPKVIWLNGANCTGCTVSLANRFSDGDVKDVADLLLNYIDLVFHPNLMGAAGDLAVQQLETAARGDYILAVDGGIPTAFGGHTCLLWTDETGHEVTAMEAVKKLAPNAAAILSIGTCASHGGMPAGNPNPTGIVSVSELIGKPTINLPGCPIHPDWIVWTVANLLAGVIPPLDGAGRPSELYHGAAESIHKVCPRKGKPKAVTFGQDNTCLKELGCRGPETRADCPSRKWNNGTNWCIGANAICLGCTESGFPDKYSPFYKIEYAYQPYDKPVEDPPVDENPNGETQVLSITKAEWRVDNSELRVEGKGKAAASVKVSDADSGVIVGAVSVASDGKWSLRQKNPVPIPGRVKVDSSGESIIGNVRNAPASSGTPTDDTTNPFRIKKAEWKFEKSELKVEGEGEIQASVEIFDASSGAKLGKVTVAADGRWKFRQKNPGSVPSRVRAKSKGIWKELNVANANLSANRMKNLIETLVSAA
jgi:hydrogenase small subunit